MKRIKFSKIIDIIGCVLPTFFWGLILFSFEEKYLAITTLLCALIHELGHLTCIFFAKGKGVSLRGTLNGFRIRSRGIYSYDQEVLIYLSGPMTNLLAFFVCLIMSFIIGTDFMTSAVINLATALSNLMPIRGYDGYGAIRACIKKWELPEGALNTLSCISSALTFAFCIFSLYLIDRYSEGYWIFAIFFLSMLKEVEAGLGE